MHSNKEEIAKYMQVLEFIESIAAEDEDSEEYLRTVRNSTEAVKKEFAKIVSYVLDRLKYFTEGFLLSRSLSQQAMLGQMTLHASRQKFCL